MNNIPNTQAEQTAAQQNFNERQLQEQKRGNDIAERSNTLIENSNRISNKSSIINAVLLGCTFIAIIISYKSVNFADKALAQADSSFSQQKRMNDSAIKWQVQSNKTDSSNRAQSQTNFESAFKLNRDAFDSSNRSNQRIFEQQIQSFKETKEEFEKENASFLRVKVNIDLNEVETTHWLALRDSIFVVGSQPIRIDSMDISRRILEDNYLVSFFDTIDVAKKFESFKFDLIRTLDYVTKESPIDIAQPIHSPISPQAFVDIVNKKKYVFMIGKIRFTNLVTKKPFIYKYIIKIFFDKDFNNYTYAFMYNENISIKK